MGDMTPIERYEAILEHVAELRGEMNDWTSADWEDDKKQRTYIAKLSLLEREVQYARLLVDIQEAVAMILPAPEAD